MSGYVAAGLAIRLQTDRLLLRTFERRDVQGWVDMFGDPEVVRFLDSTSQRRPRNAEAFAALLEMRVAMEAELGYAVLAVEFKQTGEFIGQCGLRPLSRLAPGAGDDIDLGFHFASAYWGRGYASEAVIATLEYGFSTVGLPRVMAVAEPANIGSWRVMEKAGMRYAGTVSLYGQSDLRRYRAEREWRPAGDAG